MIYLIHFIQLTIKILKLDTCHKVDEVVNSGRTIPNYFCIKTTYINHLLL